MHVSIFGNICSTVQKFGAMKKVKVAVEGPITTSVNMMISLIWRSFGPKAQGRAGGPKQAPKAHPLFPQGLRFGGSIAPSNFGNENA